jgi:hypothetical protein
MSNAWSGTLDLIRQTAEAAPSWVAACGASPAADHIVTGVGGHPWDGTLLRHDGQAKPLALPLLQIALGEPEWESTGVRRWMRGGTATIDVCLAGGPNPAGYRDAVELAEGLMDDFVTAHDSGACLMYRLRVSGPPLYLPKNAPTPFAGCWVFQLTLTWETGR